MTLKAKELKTVDELIEALLPHKGKRVEATWEGIKERIFLYVSPDDVVLLDCDSCEYQAKFQKLKCNRCNKQGSYFGKNDEILCLTCGAENWRKDNE